MGIGARSALWRRALFWLFGSIYFRRKCKTVDGTFEAYVSPNSYLGVLDFRKSPVDQVHERFIRKWVNSDAVVWDIGGNLGLFALPAALKATRGRVYTLEPDVELASNLLRSLRLRQNQKLNVTVACVAVSNIDGAASFQISKFSRAMNKLEAVGKWHEQQLVTKELRLVPTMRIDTLAKTLASPTVLKIDVEGAEIEVLEGGEATIARCRPIILIEGPSELSEPMLAFFQRHHYTILDGEVEHPWPLSHPVWNTIAIPEERLSES
jgi:FkbM family methyltransferase